MSLKEYVEPSSNNPPRHILSSAGEQKCSKEIPKSRQRTINSSRFNGSQNGASLKGSSNLKTFEENPNSVEVKMPPISNSLISKRKKVGVLAIPARVSIERALQSTEPEETLSDFSFSQSSGRMLPEFNQITSSQKNKNVTNAFYSKIVNRNAPARFMPLEDIKPKRKLSNIQNIVQILEKDMKQVFKRSRNLSLHVPESDYGSYPGRGSRHSVKFPRSDNEDLSRSPVDNPFDFKAVSSDDL